MNPIILSILNLIRGQTSETSLVNFDSSLIFEKFAEIEIRLEHYLLKMVLLPQLM